MDCARFTAGRRWYQSAPASFGRVARHGAASGRMMTDDPSGAELQKLAAVIVATPAMAFITAILRAVWEDKEDSKTRILIEAFLCSFISLFVMAAIVLLAIVADFNLPIVADHYQLLVLFIIASGIGSFVGFIGAVQIRIYIRRFLNNRITANK